MVGEAPGGRDSEEVLPRLAEGVELIGAYEGSGYKEPPALARRSDGQIVQITPLLQLIAAAADGSRDYGAIGRTVSEQYGRAVSADNVRTLVEEKLRPLGLLAAADGTSPKLQKPDPLLALKFRRAIIPEHRCQRVASVFKPLFFPPVVMAVIAGLVAFDIWLFLSHGVAQGFREALYSPGLMLLVLVLVVLSAGWHEFGHAAGCAYSGGCPGAMGAGIYLAYPAFYTDVTDSYRLTRAGRLRTDLAGVYFNSIFILATAGLYAVTGFEPLLLVILIQHIEIAHQLLPILRLDGYYVVADLTGVPDLFARIKPILTSLAFWRKPDESVRQLKMWVRVVVTAWVLVVIPLLLFQLGMLLLHAPRIFATAFDSLGQRLAAIGRGFGEGDVLAVLGGVFQSLILVVPLVGVALTFARLGGRLGQRGWKATQGKPLLRGGFSVVSGAALAGLVYVWLPNGDYQPIRPGEKGTLDEGLVAIRRVATGRSSLVPQQRAQERGQLGPAADPESGTPGERDETQDGEKSTPTTGPSTTATTAGHHTAAPATTFRRSTPTSSLPLGGEGAGSDPSPPSGADMGGLEP